MGTPTFVKLSRIPGTPADAFERLAEEVFLPLQIQPREFVQLRRSRDPYDAGLAEHGERVPVASMDDLVQLAREHSLFGTVHLVPYVPGYLYFHVFDVKPESFSLTMSFDASLLTWESNRFAMGEWVKSLLTMLAAGLRAEVCGYGKDPAYEVEYESLSPARVVERLRSGELLQIWYPTFHAISVELISVSEVRTLMKNRTATLATQDLMHEVSATGYHLLYILP